MDVFASVCVFCLYKCGSVEVCLYVGVGLRV